jgi:hypothetical protein
MQQIYFLHHTKELGFAFKNRGAVIIYNKPGGDGVLAGQMKQMPEITELIDADEKLPFLLPPESGYSFAATIDSWDEKPSGAEKITFITKFVSTEYINYADFRLLSGTTLKSSGEILLYNQHVRIKRDLFKRINQHGRRNQAF